VAGKQPRYLVIGRIGRAHGIHGEVGIDVMTDFPERFEPGRTLYLGSERDEAPEPATIITKRPHRQRLLVKFGNSPDRNAAELLTGLFVLIPSDDAASLEPDTYYPFQLIGLEALREDGSPLGRVKELMETGTADVLIIRGDERDVLVPMIGEAIASIDLEAGQLVVRDMPGLLD
jgi:16S rRNA processing protein RimM